MSDDALADQRRAAEKVSHSERQVLDRIHGALRARPVSRAD